MKRLILFMVVWMCGLTAVGQGGMQALFGYSTFYLPEQNRPYVETYLSFDAWTLRFAEVEAGVYRATVEVTLVVRQGDSVCFLKKYNLNSPTIGSLDELDFSFLDVQRFSLGNGIYDMELWLRDEGTDADASRVTEKLVVYYDNEHPMMSSLQLMSGAEPTVEENILSRGGYDMEPYVNDFVPEQVDRLNVYYEIYNVEKEVGRKPFMTVVYIENKETGKRAGGIEAVNRRNSSDFVPVYTSLDISSLPSGNYNLVVELRNRDNQTFLYKKLSFFRSNPGVKSKEVSDFATTFAGRYTDENELDIYLDALYPIASEEEKQVSRSLIHRPGLEEKQAFLYRFWQERNAMDPEGEWLRYKERVDYVQEHFSYPRTLGIHTDRGRVYLQYGPPDFVRDEKNFVSALRIGNYERSQFEMENHTMLQGNTENPAAGMYDGPSQGHVYYLPYQLWRYNKLDTDDPNRVFLFWDEHRSGFYTLLNSNARGEVQDPGWERRLCRNQLKENVIGEVGEQFKRGY